MLWILALHIIAMVTWFSGLFYLPRLFVYHSTTRDDISIARFKIMERRVFYGITTPGGIMTIAFGLWLTILNWPTYRQAGWFHAKLTLVLVLILYHIYCGYLVNVFKNDKNQKTETFYRWFNEFHDFVTIGGSAS